MCEFTINSAHSSSVKASPFELVYSQNPRIPAVIDTGPIPEAVQATEANAAKFMIARVAESVAHARRCMAQAQQRAKFYADQHRRDLEFEVGDQVLLCTSHMHRSGAGRSLLLHFIGPHRVTKRIGTVAYELQLPASMKMHDVFHVSMLQPYASDWRHQPPPATSYLMGQWSLRWVRSCSIGPSLLERPRVAKRLAQRNIWFFGADRVLSMTLGNQNQFCAMPRSSWMSIGPRFMLPASECLPAHRLLHMSHASTLCAMADSSPCLMHTWLCCMGMSARVVAPLRESLIRE